MTEDAELVEAVKKLLGQTAYFPDGSLNRAWVGAKVFADQALLAQLNALVHPATKRDFYLWISSLENYAHSCVFREAAILFESGAWQDCDYIVTVYAPKNVRLERVIARDGHSREAILQRMDKQWADQERIYRSDFVLVNDGIQEMDRQVLVLEEALKKLNIG